MERLAVREWGSAHPGGRWMARAHCVACVMRQVWRSGEALWQQGAYRDYGVGDNVRCARPRPDKACTLMNQQHSARPMF